jgi:hypothetical protein
MAAGGLWRGGGARGSPAWYKADEGASPPNRSIRSLTLFSGSPDRAGKFRHMGVYAARRLAESQQFATVAGRNCGT